MNIVTAKITSLVSIRQLSTNENSMTALNLYKYLFKECKKLPKDAQQYYKHTIRQSFKQHVAESDPERIKEIIARAMEDSKWILKKYSGKS